MNQPATSESDVFPCPVCREHIKIGATLCRFCRTDLRQGAAPPQQVAPTAPKPPTKILGSSPAAIVAAVVILGGLGALGAWQAGAFNSGRTDPARVAAYVECGAGTPNGVPCTVSNNQDRPANVCWRMTTTCRNGATMTADACLQVPAGGKSTKLLLDSDFHSNGSCDQGTSTRIDVQSAR